MGSGFWGEYFGTLLLILLGNGAVANVLLAKSKGNGGGWIVITAGWGFAVLCGIMVAIALGSEGHINPAVTVAFAYASNTWNSVPTYLAGQILGAFTGAVLVWVTYLPHWAQTECTGTKLACFSTGPAIRNLKLNFVTEAVATFVLVFVVIAIFAKPVGSTGVLGPLMVGFLVWGIGLSLGGPTGYAINPARDLAPRVAHAVLPIAGKGSSDWGYAWVPVFGPIVGGLLAIVVSWLFAMS
ncbi:Glycerol uptake facilitator protein [Hyphomicrobium sulfonivorans]|uniref:Glycerol uptake facilitator protein n=1 Tax=Hyphomicrobium sulfonivorans TaxID=121290 RepID=A0A109BI74_HYPSL|nr:MIP/aquaporin family protein [Hyphomicrobium sulfonivorans]KWT69308.1 Glycerol uptake facilitator protein [Hyphomicrobium sulfonivorans]